MNSPIRRAEFFVLEATEYLADLDQLVSRTETPDLERLVRGARALRGAALMAGLGTFARASASLEGLARQVRDHALGWEPHARAAWREGLQTLRGLVSRAGGWESADDRHALLLAERIERVAKGEALRDAPDTPQLPDHAGHGLTPGVRAFIARESALIAGSLQEAARALAPLKPPVALASVLERLRSLRGLGGSAELSPLPELLDAMEVTTRSLLSPDPAPPDIAVVFADAADALAAMAQSVSDQGRVVIPTGLEQIARRLLEGYAALSDVTDIASLAPSGEASVISRGSPPQAPPAGDPVPIELVGVGDHLLMQSEALARGRSPAARDLRLFVLHQTLSTMPAESRTGRFLGPLTGAIARTIGSGRAHGDPDAFVAMLRDCGQFLIDHGGDGTVADLTARRDAMARALGAADLIPSAGTAVTSTAPVADAGPVSIPASTAVVTPVESEPMPVRLPEPAPAVDPTAPPDVVVEIATLAPDDDLASVVEIAALAPDSPEREPDDAAPVVDIGSLDFDEHDVVPIAALAPDTPDVVPIASLAPDDPGVVPIASLAFDPPEPQATPATVMTASRVERAYRRLRELDSRDSTPERRVEDDEEVFDIGVLLYRGERALVRADEIRGELAVVLSVTSIDLACLRPLLDELLDLVPLARDVA
ncbi:MAG TPA: Hpt domain-containing protein [Gemmatimonadales bacterium]|nr:Hpt domain-containing protein [Gemmatimonadales bacterium]